MVALAERDVRRYLEFAHETERVARFEPRRFNRWVIEGIGTLVPSDGISHLESNRGIRGRFEASLTRAYGSNSRAEAARNRVELMTAWNERFAYEHPISAYRLRHPYDLRAVRLSDFMSVTRYRQLEVFDVLSRPFGVARNASVGYRGRRGLNEIVCARTSLDFSERDLLLLDLAASAVSLAARDPAPAPPPGGGRLTAREREVLERVARGCSNTEIAQALLVAPGTVKKHLDNIFAKLGVRNRVEAARAWHMLGHG